MSLADIKKVIENQNFAEQGRPMPNFIYAKKEDFDRFAKGLPKDPPALSAPEVEYFKCQMGKGGQAKNDRPGLRFYERYPEKSKAELLAMFMDNM